MKEENVTAPGNAVDENTAELATQHPADPAGPTDPANPAGPADLADSAGHSAAQAVQAVHDEEPVGPMVIAINVTGDQVGAGLGRAHTMAVAVIANGRITDWDEEEVGWDISHDQAGEGHHHATIVRFMQEHHIEVAVSGHMGPPMVNTLRKLGVVPLVGAEGPAKDAALAAAALVQEQASSPAAPQA